LMRTRSFPDSKAKRGRHPSSRSNTPRPPALVAALVVVTSL
jgi:hypothetical protein